MKIETTEITEHLLLKVTNELVVSRNLTEALEKLVSMLTGMIGAERGTIFLNDKQSSELYSRVAQGNFMREIRILNNSGIAGWVFTHNESTLVKDAYADPRFNREVDERTGFTTKTILCAPLKTLKGETIGVSQILNKNKGHFTDKDLALLMAVTQQAAIALQSHLVIEQMEEARKQESEFLDVVTQVSSEIQLSVLLSKIIATITKMLDADRSTLFINDEKTNQLYTEVGEGLGKTQIRFPNYMGIAGTVFTTGKSINIPHAYADLRFNPSFDKQTGFFTRSILCTPVRNKDGKMIGVTQVLNKKGGSFTKEDEARLIAFTSQIAIGIENAKLFDDIQNMKNYNESILESMTNGVLTINEDGKIMTCNAAGLKILKSDMAKLAHKEAQKLFSGPNKWLWKKIKSCTPESTDNIVMDAELNFGGDRHSVNVTVLPLTSIKQKAMGTMVMIEDISNEKRMKSTMSRYMDPALADKVLGEGELILGGTNSMATVLFSDIRSFTTLTEELGAQGTVSLLNEYFSIMVDCLTKEGGMLDKYIGDAMMAVFGTPLPHPDDADRGVRAAVAMMKELQLYNDRRLAQGKKKIDIGIGLNSDTVVSGNIGSAKRMDYTVIGDGVNLASRLEGACKQYGAHIIISEFTLANVKATYRTREVDKVIVKGKTKPVAIYEVLDYHTEKSFPNMMDALDSFKSGLESYKKLQWDNAIKHFTQALKANPDDKLSQMYVGRCDQFKETPPPADWDGVWTMKSK